MPLNNPDADIYVPQGIPLDQALARTTHLCIVAHQDDIEIAAFHGIAACYRQPDKWFSGVVVTDGRGSPRSGVFADYSDDEMVEVRRQEQREAARLGEYSVQFQLHHPSALVKDPAASEPVEDLVQILGQTQPEILYLHNPADKHLSHIAVLLRSLEAIRRLPLEKRPKKAYGCEVWRNLDWLLDADKVALPVDLYPELNEQLVGVFQSQIAGGKRYDLASRGRQLANATFFNSHATDGAQAITWALDLTPLIKDDTRDIHDYTLSLVERFEQDVSAKLKTFQR